MKPNDFEELQKSKQFATVIRTCIASRNGQISWYGRWLECLKELEKMIAIELNENKK